MFGNVNSKLWTSNYGTFGFLKVFYLFLSPFFNSCFKEVSRLTFFINIIVKTKRVFALLVGSGLYS